MVTNRTDVGVVSDKVMMTRITRAMLTGQLTRRISTPYRGRFSKDFGTIQDHGFPSDTAYQYTCMECNLRLFRFNYPLLLFPPCCVIRPCRFRPYARGPAEEPPQPCARTFATSETTGLTRMAKVGTVSAWTSTVLSARWAGQVDHARTRVGWRGFISNGVMSVLEVGL